MFDFSSESFVPTPLIEESEEKASVKTLDKPASPVGIKQEENIPLKEEMDDDSKYTVQSQGELKFVIKNRPKMGGPSSSPTPIKSEKVYKEEENDVVVKQEGETFDAVSGLLDTMSVKTGDKKQVIEISDESPGRLMSEDYSQYEEYHSDVKKESSEMECAVNSILGTETDMGGYSSQGGSLDEMEQDTAIQSIL